MNRRDIIKLSALLGFSSFSAVSLAKTSSRKTESRDIDDRAYWIAILTRIATPVLDNISKQQLRKNMPMEVSPTFDKRDPGVGYLEAFGRLLAGMAPWLALPDDNTSEGVLRKKFREQALLGIRHGVDPSSPD